MIKITFKYEGKSVDTDATEGETLLQLAERNNIPLIGGCGGACVCGSCRVEIDMEHINLLPEAEFNEQDILECLPMCKPTSRLACQVVITKDMDGMVVTVG